MKKIIVIGCPGSGKSTFSKTLHQITGLPLVHLDMLYWNSDKTTVDKAVFSQRLSEALQGNEWIIDGNYHSTMELRMQACDTVVFLDYPEELCLSGVRERRGKARSDMPWTEAASEEDAAFMEFIRHFRAEIRPQILALLEKYRFKEIYRFTGRSEAAALLAQLR